MRAFCRWFAALVLVCSAIAAQPQSLPANSSGILTASNFAQWNLPQGSSPANGSISWTPAFACNVNATGFTFTAARVNRPIRIIDSNPANSETVVPTSVTVNSNSCTLNAPMTHVHTSYTVVSGTLGLQEAIDYAGSKLGAVVLITPSWSQLGGITSMLANAYGNSNVSILDERTSVIVPWVWNGSNYVAQPFGGGIIPAPPILSGQASNGGTLQTTNELFAGAGTTPQQLVTAAAAASSGFASLVGGQAYSLSSTVIVGDPTSKFPMNLYVNPFSKMTFSQTDGSDGIDVCDGSGIYGGGGGVSFENTTQSPSVLTTNATGPPAVMGSMIAPCDKLGHEQYWWLDSLTVQPNPNATFNNPVVDIEGNFSGTHVNNLIISNFGSAPAGLAIQSNANNDSHGKGFTSVIDLNNVIVAGASAHTTGDVFRVWAIPGSANGVGSVTITHCNFENGAPGFNLAEYNGNARTNGDMRVSDVFNVGCHYESGSKSTVNGVLIQDTSNISAIGQNASDPGNVLFTVSESVAGNSRSTWLQGSNTVWPVSLIDWVSAFNSSTLNGAISPGATSIIVNAVAANTLLAGMPLQIMDGQSLEYATVAFGYAGGTTIPLAAPTTFAHNSGVTVKWNPVYYDGPGSLGGQLNSLAGNTTVDGNSIVTFSGQFPTLPIFYHINKQVYIASSANADPSLALGKVTITGFGAYCTNSTGGQMTCAQNQFQFIAPGVTNYTSVGTVISYSAPMRTYNYKVAEDSTVNDNIDRIPRLASDATNPFQFMDGVIPQAFCTYNYAVAGIAIFARSCQGFGLVASSPNDFWFLADAQGGTGFPVTAPGLHFATAATNTVGNVAFGIKAVDKYTLLESDSLLHKGTVASPQGPVTIAPTTSITPGDAVVWRNAVDGLGDAGGPPALLNPNTVFSNVDNIFTANQTIGAQGVASSSNFSSFVWQFKGAYSPDGITSVDDCWQIFDQVNAGTNPSTYARITHTCGSTGIHGIFVDGNVLMDNAGGFVGTLDSSLLTANATFRVPNIAGTSTLTTGPATGTAGDIATFVGANGQIQDSNTLLSSLAPLASPGLTGTPTAPTATLGTNTTQLSTTAFVQAAVTNGVSGLAPLASPALTGTPTAPTATAGTNTTQLATTAYVQTAVTGVGTTLVAGCQFDNQSAVTGTGSAVTVATCTVPANTIPATGCLAMDLLGAKVGTNTMSVAAQFGASIGTLTMGSSATAGEWHMNGRWCNNGSTSGGTQSSYKYGVIIGTTVSGSLYNGASTNPNTSATTFTLSFTGTSPDTYQLQHLQLKLEQ